MSDTAAVTADGLDAALAAYRRRVDAALLERLPPLDGVSPRLAEAMRYAVTAGGKRVRPVLTYATGRALGLPLERLDDPACAVEMLHAYSLVHDDLPAMDDDDLRRGQPTCHRRFDEATAILAGDALQALAFTILAGSDDDASLPSEARVAMVRLLGEASGANGMAAGQAIDLEAVGRSLTIEALETMHRHKTGALIRASVALAAAAAGHGNGHGNGSGGGDGGRGIAERLDGYAAAVGLSFQIVDDILDVVADTATLGKTQGADIALDKPTYPSLLGLDGARRHARAMHERALACLDGLGDSFDELRALSAYVIERGH